MLNTSPARFVGALAACTTTLFVWSGVSQLFPWGVPTVRNVAQTTDDPSSFGASPLRLAPGELTTAAFDEVLGLGVSTLMTDRSFAWIVSVPRSRYDPVRYFAWELVSQLGCALVLVVALSLLSPLPWRRRGAVLALFAVGASVATYGVMTNWWGLPLRYSAGMGLNLVMGWLLSGAVGTLVLRQRERVTTPAPL